MLKKARIMKTSFLIFAVFLITYTKGNDDCKCDVPSMFLDEIKCKPVYENPGDCCPIKYDCSEFDNRPKGKCHLLGQYYNPRQMVPDDLIYPHCKVNCYCGGFSATDFTCAILECPEMLGWSKTTPGCYRKYETKGCCSTGEICPPFDNLTTCEVDGKTYREGEEFQANSDPTLKCTCQKGFSGAFVEPFCIKKKCLTEVDDAEQIDKYCAPVYFKTNEVETPMCPFEFICSMPEDQIVRSAVKSAGDHCRVGDQKLHKGEKYRKTEKIAEYEEYITNCECKIPPFATCVKTVHLDFDKMPAHIRQHYD